MNDFMNEMFHHIKVLFDIKYLLRLIKCHHLFNKDTLTSKEEDKS